MLQTCFPYTSKNTIYINVFQQPADMIPNYNEGRLEIRFHTMSTRRENESLAELCNIVNKEKFLYPGTELKLVLKAA